MNTRDKFHAWLVTLGYRDDIKPLPSGSYNSENVDALWGCWQAANSLVEQEAPLTLSQIRHTLAWTQEHMAKELGISLRTYCRNEKSGGSKTLQKMASLIYVSFSKDKAAQNQTLP